MHAKKGVVSSLAPKDRYLGYKLVLSIYLWVIYNNEN